MDEKAAHAKNGGSLGFLFDRKSQSVLLHLRDDKTSYNPNAWAFFGGWLEPGEGPEECFIREIKEETGIEVRPEEVIPLTDYFNDEFGVYRYVFYVEKFVPRSDIVLTEGQDCEWIPLEKVFDYDLTDKTRKDLKTFLQKY